MYILNDFLQITAPTSIILYIIEIRKKSSIEWCKELTPSDRSFRIVDWRYRNGFFSISRHGRTRDFRMSFHEGEMPRDCRYRHIGVSGHRGIGN